MTQSDDDSPSKNSAVYDIINQNLTYSDDKNDDESVSVTLEDLFHKMASNWQPKATPKKVVKRGRPVKEDNKKTEGKVPKSRKKRQNNVNTIVVKL